MGRYADQLKEMTRARGGGPAVSPPVESASARRRAPRWGTFVVAGLVLSLALGGWLLMRQMMDDAKLQDCVMSGRKNCAPAGITP